MASHEFFIKYRPWSERKHRLLRSYLQPFSAKVASITSDRQIFVVDGFAGKGQYDDGRDGSPVLIAKFSDECAKWLNPVKLKLINVEPDLDNEGIFEQLQTSTATWRSSGVVENLRLKFSDAVPNIVQRIGSAPVLFFIDPFGPSYLHFDDLRPILERTNNATEVIINFDQDGLLRILKAALSKNTYEKVAAANRETVSLVLGSDDWADRLLGNDLSSAESEQLLLSLYCQNLSNFGYSVVAYPIREKLKSRPKYHFIYCTRHIDGLLLMNDFVRKEEDLIYGDHVAEDLPLFSEEASFAVAVRDRRQVLEELVLFAIDGRDKFTRREIRIEIVQTRFGEFNRSDLNNVFATLIANRRITVISGKSRINDSEPLRKT